LRIEANVRPFRLARDVDAGDIGAVYEWLDCFDDLDIAPHGAAVLAMINGILPKAGASKNGSSRICSRPPGPRGHVSLA